jgi:hypothetical protein
MTFKFSQLAFKIVPTCGEKYANAQKIYGLQTTTKRHRLDRVSLMVYIF